MSLLPSERSPGTKFGLAVAVAMLLVIPLFSIWLIVYDRKSQSETAQTSIAQGWGGPQVISGPLLVIPYRDVVSETVTENNRPVVRAREVWKELSLAPETVRLATDIRPERRKRSIYEVVVYDARVSGQARFALPADLERSGVTLADMALDRAELRFGISDPRGLGANPRISIGGQPLRLQPGGGTSATGGSGFFAWLDARPLVGAAITSDFAFDFRGNGSLSLAPRAGDTRWSVRSAWPHPSFAGGFLPATHRIGDQGFSAEYRFGNLSLGQSLVSTGDARPGSAETMSVSPGMRVAPGDNPRGATISLFQPVDLYSKVDRSVKYGFLFIGFTFLALLLFDVIGGVRVSVIEYLLVGAALILFFVLLLAFAEVIGFTLAYIVASTGIIGLITAYSAAVLGSWRRAAFIGALLTALYVVLYILLSLEAFSLLIGSLLLFAALAALMYLTRHVRWGGRDEGPAGA